eukprot:scaffold109688_cov31-Tisochrysis_lutea.AAC.1
MAMGTGGAHRRDSPQNPRLTSTAGEAAAVPRAARIGTSIVRDEHDAIVRDNPSEGREAEEKVVAANGEIDVTCGKEPQIPRHQVELASQLATRAVELLALAIDADLDRLDRPARR